MCSWSSLSSPPYSSVETELHKEALHDCPGLGGRAYPLGIAAISDRSDENPTPLLMQGH